MHKREFKDRVYTKLATVARYSNPQHFYYCCCPDPLCWGLCIKRTTTDYLRRFDVEKIVHLQPLPYS